MKIQESKFGRSVAVFCAMALILALASTAFGQSSLGSVRGSVRDQTGAVIPAAKLDLVNKATGVEMHAESNESGQYTFPAVLPGQYTLAVASAGMETLQIGLEVQVQVSTTYNAVLKPGATETKITVSAEMAPLTTTDSPVLGHVLETQRISMLPINGRDIQNLIVTVPGLELSATANQVRSYGMQAGAHQYILDGAVLEESMWQESTVIRPPGIETIQEFKVENNGSSAKFTRMTNIIMSTKSGTNQIHGSGFEANRDNRYGKSRTRTDYAMTSDGKPNFPVLQRNEYGGTIGGPVWIPKIYNGKNRTFFFFSYEGFRVNTPASYSASVPTTAMRGGDFSGLVDSLSRLTTIYDPWTTNTTSWARQPFSYGGKLNAIDPSKQTALSKYLLNTAIFQPSPGYETTNPLLNSNWYGAAVNDTKEVTNTYRIDHRFSDKDSIYARYNHAPHTKVYQVQCAPTADQLACQTNDNAINTSGALNWVHQFTPTFFNEALFTIATTWRDRITGDGKTSYADQFGLPNAFSQVGFPFIQDLGIGSNLVPNNRNKMTFAYPILDDNATKIWGKHELQFGVHIRRNMLNMLPQQVFYTGITSFSGGATALYDGATSRTNPGSTVRTGQGAANAYLGLAGYYQNDLRKGTFKIRSREDALYFQDNFKVTPRLTLNLGLRWQFTPFMTEASGIPIPGFSKRDHAIVLSQPVSNLISRGITYQSIINAYQAIGMKFETWDQAGVPQKMGYDSWKDWGPHLGFAYRLFDGPKSFVIRGGLSKSYYQEGIYLWLDQSAAATPLTASFNRNYNDATQSADGIGAGGLRTVPTVIAGVNSRNEITLANPVGITPGSNYNYFFNPSQPTNYVWDWNLTVEKDVKNNSMIRFGLVGNHGGNQMAVIPFNAASPSYVWYMTTHNPMPTGYYSAVARNPYDNTVYGTLDEYVKTQWSNFSGFQATYERRYSKGYAFQVWYVTGNAMRAGGADSAGGYNVSIPLTNQYMPGTVPSDTYARNRFLNYRRDTANQPKHRVRWNYVVDLPFGRGKPIARNAGRFLNGVVGGWQLASMGTIWTTYVSLSTSNFVNTGEPIHFYGYSHPIQNCTSVTGATGGQCYPGYLWSNAYISPRQINSYDPATGRPNGYMGIPDDFKPYQVPLITWGQTTMPANAPANTVLSTYWDTNNIWIPLSDGTTSRLSYGEIHPYRNQFFGGPNQWNQDASLYKSFTVREGMALRFNFDAFNVTNHPNNNGSGGIMSTQGQSNGARQLQLAIRLTW